MFLSEITENWISDEIMSRFISFVILTLLHICEADDGSSYGDSYHKLSWFIHITDVHISSWEDSTRQTQLEQFVTSTLASIKPELVMCGGDLTEAKPNGLTSTQDVREWETYRDIVSSRWNTLPWLDIRGNHDSLNVMGRNSSKNYYATHSVMGQLGHMGSYLVTREVRGQTLNFVAVDATWDVGMNYPFNFNGYIDTQQITTLDNITANLQQDSVTIMFGHYPTSVVQQQNYLRNLISHGMVYLSGHLHDLAFFRMHNMYSFHNDLDLELELIDWKNNRKFRVLAVDQGKLSFTDVHFDSWPIVLPTYPKDSRFMMPGKENYEVYHRNTIRVLVFSDVAIARVTIAVDDEDVVEASQEDNGPLYTLPWDATKHAIGLHKLSVTAIDINNRSKMFEQQFTLNPSEAEQVDNWFPNFVLQSSFSLLFIVLFLLTLLFNLTTALSLKLLYFCAQTNRLSLKNLKCLRSCAKFCIFRKLFLVCSYNKIFLPLLCFVIYMAIGPWVVGSLIEGHSGAVFAWGALVAGRMVHSQIPFAYYFVHFAIIHPVVVLVIGHVLDHRNSVHTNSVKSTKVTHVSFLAYLLLVLVASIYFSLTFWFQFGIIGFVLGPLKTWSYIFYGVMFWLAWTVPRDHCQIFNSLFNQEDLEKKSDSIDGGSETSEEKQQNLHLLQA